MEQILAHMERGFNKADLDKLEAAFGQAAWSLLMSNRSYGKLREFFRNGQTTLALLQRQDSIFEYYVGVPERA